MSKWTPADEQRLKLSLTKAVFWLGQVSYRGHCLVCEHPQNHEHNCPLEAVRTKLANIREEERRATVRAANRRRMGQQRRAG